MAIRADHQIRAFANQADHHRKMALALAGGDGYEAMPEDVMAHALLSISYELSALRRVLERDNCNGDV